MVGNGRTEIDLLDTVTAIRVKNNSLWMQILEIALTKAPTETKELIKQIVINDTLVSQEMARMVDAADDPH